MDIKSREQRSRNMAKIKGSNTQPEVYIRSLLYCRGLRYRVNYLAVQGKPDMYFSRYKVAIFIHGCFWHRHKNCTYAYTPKSNVEFWTNKFEGNIKHDDQVISNLKNEGIRVLVIWECTIKKMHRDPEFEKQVCESIQKFILEKEDDFLEI